MTTLDGETVRGDLGVNGYETEPRSPDSPRISSLGLQFFGGSEPSSLLDAGRQAHVRVLGALGGPIRTADPERLRYEARRLLAAADMLAAEQAAATDET